MFIRVCAVDLYSHTGNRYIFSFNPCLCACTMVVTVLGLFVSVCLLVFLSVVLLRL